VAVITDGSAVLGLGNIGPEAAAPVMEGKCAIFKKIANIDAFPICIKTQNSSEIIRIIKNISSIFGGINLEDISAPRCFEIEKKLSRKLDIPVFHDDQYGTAIIVAAGLINALKVVNKRLSKIKVTISGAGAAGYAITKLIHQMGVSNITALDSKGIISHKRDYLYPHKKELLKILAKEPSRGGIKEALKGADVFIGVSKGNLLKKDDVMLMNKKAIIFALANPQPEILPAAAKTGGAAVVATGRSDFPNQLNNALVFPGFFRGLLNAKITKINNKMRLAAARALASLIKKPSPKNIIPSIFDKRVVPAVANAVTKFKIQSEK
jgi:malate dehydrogenase (oxaloacetate-decarboxylating)